MIDLTSIDPTVDKPKPQHNITKWDYVYNAILEIRDDEEGRKEVEIFSSSYLPLNGGLNSDCYYSECVADAEPSDFLFINGIGKLETTLEPGIYRFTCGVKTDGGYSWTDIGYEYDAWETYEILAYYKFTDEEVPYIINSLHEDDPEDERFIGNENG